VALAEWEIQPLNHSVLFLKEADIVLTNGDWRVAIDFDLSTYREVILTTGTDLHTVENQRQEFTSVSKLKQIGVLLQTLDSKLLKFRKFLPRLDRRRGLLNLGGTVLKTLFGTATIPDIQELHSVFDDLQTKNSDIVHSWKNQLSYVEKLNKITTINADAIEDISNIVKHDMIKSHDKFQQITRDIVWLNVTICGQSEISMAVRRLEFALLQLTQQIYDLFIALQCAIQGNLSVKLIDPLTLQNILRNVILQLPEGYKLIPGSKTENIHQYYQIAKVTVAATAHCIKLIISISLETASQHFTLYKITTLPESITFDKLKYSVEYSYLGIETSQHDYILFSETGFGKCSRGDIIICQADTTIYSAQRLSCVFSLYFQFHTTTFVKESYYFTTKLLHYNDIIHDGSIIFRRRKS
jgi:hypothetical protein